MSKLTLSTLTGGYGDIATLNANFAAIAAAFDNTLSRDGTAPNTLGATLDTNSKRVINLPAPGSVTEPLRLGDLALVTNGVAVPVVASEIPFGTGTALAQDANLTWDNVNKILHAALAYTLPGGVQQTVTNKFSNLACSPEDFGAVADGVTDCTVAIQQATNTFRTVVFQPGTYKITAPIDLSAGTGCYWIGSRGVSTIIKNTAGTDVIHVPAGDGNKGPYILENLRLTGSAAGIASSSGGYNVYIDNLKLRSVFFDTDLLFGINGNLILADIQDCGFGTYGSVANPSGIHVKSQSGAGNQTNVNRFVNCVFNGCLGANAVQFTDGLILKFENCAWEFNKRMLTLNSMSFVVIDNCFSEGNVDATSLIDVSSARTRTIIRGGSHQNTTMNGSFVRSTPDAPVLMEDADIYVSGTGFIFTDSVSGSHLTESVRIDNCRLTGNNGGDPALFALRQAFTGLDIGFTSVGGAGATDVWRNLGFDGTTALANTINGTLRFFVRDATTGANQAVYEYFIAATSNGVTNAALTQTQRVVRGTDPGVSATPFALVADGGGGAVKVQFTKSASIATVQVFAKFYGMIIN